jgi:hypothetical protein
VVVLHADVAIIIVVAYDDPLHVEEKHPKRIGVLCSSIWRHEKQEGDLQQDGAHGNVKGEAKYYMYPHS